MLPGAARYLLAASMRLNTKYLVCLLLFCCQACAAAPISLWEVKSDTATVYLMGSIHAFKEEMYPLPAPFEAAYQAADKTVFEVDMETANTYEASLLIKERGTYPGLETVETNLPPETLEKLRAYLSKNQLPLAAFSRIKPWLILLQVGIFEIAKLGYVTEQGIDLHFQNKARADGKPLLALETFEAQIELLSSDTPEVQAIALDAALDDVDALPTQIEAMIDHWQVGDAEGLYKMTVAEYEDVPALKTQLFKQLDNRNLGMARKIEAYLATDETYLVVVGSAHMGGEQGLLSLLGKHYKIKQFQHSPE